MQPPPRGTRRDGATTGAWGSRHRVAQPWPRVAPPAAGPCRQGCASGIGGADSLGKGDARAGSDLASCDWSRIPPPKRANLGCGQWCGMHWRPNIRTPIEGSSLLRHQLALAGGRFQRCPWFNPKIIAPTLAAGLQQMPSLNLQDHHTPRHAALSRAQRPLAHRASCRLDRCLHRRSVQPLPHSSRCCRRSDAWLAVLAGTQLGHRAKLGWQRRPPGDAPGARPRLRVVGDSWEPPAQLDNGRQLSLLIEDGADSGGIGFGDDEHPQSMVVSTTACKRDVRCFQAWQRPRRANRFELL